MNNLQSTYNLIRRYLAEHRILKAVDQLKCMAAASGAPWQMMRDIDTIAESYGYLCRYALDGIDDPSRGDLLADITNDIRRMASAVMRQAEIPSSPRQYFSVIRYEALQPDSSICDLIDKYKSDYAAFSRDTLTGKNADSSQALARQREIEQLASRIFNLIWVTSPLTSEQYTRISEIFSDGALPDYFKELLVSALTLGALEYYDERRILLLAHIYVDGDVRISMRALCGLLISMWRHRNSLTGRRIRNALDSIAELPQWHSDLKMAFMELVRTRDTERISRTLNDEVLPTMIKLRPDIMDKIKKSGESPEEMLSIDENPEWSELFDKSGLSDKLKELSELQSDGGDVMMSTFSHMKAFPFFNNPAEWFLPFYPEHTAVTGIVGFGGSEIVELISASPMMCDSDKYSIILSLERIPAANRRMMLDQFKIQNINIAEINNANLNPDADTRRNICNKYIQDLYRFFNLYRRKTDFYNPFATPVNLASIDLLSHFFDDNDTLIVIAEFYFKRGYHQEALEVFDLLLSRPKPSPQILQKCGYSLQQTGQIEKALDMYLRSELLHPDSVWTLRRIAQCYKMTGDTPKALQYYKRVEDIKPNDISAALNVGHCLMAMGDYTDALKRYFKVEYLSPDSHRALRPIAWCLFLSGDLKRSEEYYNRLLKLSPTASDYLNIAHLQMALKHYREALNYYNTSRQVAGETVDALLMRIHHDRQQLVAAGVSPDIIDIVCDYISE